MRASSDRGGAGSTPDADVGGMRASDAERDQAIGELRDRFAEGRLSQDTFLHRMDAALRAKNRSDLTGLLRDLPGSGARGKPPGPKVKDRLLRLHRAVAGRLAVTRRRAGAWQPAPQPLCLPPHDDGKFTIGRALACDFMLADPSVSRWHAKLHKEEEHWLLSDLGSTNGTRLNGWRVTTGVPVRPGDQVSFGAVTFVITERPARAV